MPDPTRDRPPTAVPPADDHTPDLTGARTDPPGPTVAPPAAGAVPVVPGFDLLEEVGRGGMGVVYRARDTAFGRDVAVKLLQDRYPADGVAARRFADEARITGQLQHPGIPAAYQTGVLPDGRPFLAMKLIKGETLADLVKAGGPPSVAAFEGVCQAVGYAHAHGVVHRDLKPANVMVGTFAEVQVMDWGLAKVLADRRPDPTDPDITAPGTEFLSTRDPADATKAGSLLGTPAYMAPEQAIGAVDEIDQRTDVFGLGAVLCAILTGKPPYRGDSAEENRKLAARAKLDDAHVRLDGSGADPGLVALCKRCLSADKAARPGSAGAVAAEVAALRAAADERARRAEVERGRAEVRRRLVQRWAAGVAAVLLLGVGGTTAGLVRANAAQRDEATARQAADDKRVEAENARIRAENAERAEAAQKAIAQTKQAEAETAQQREAAERKVAVARTAAATAANEFLQSVLFLGNPRLATKDRAANPNRTLREALDFASKEIAGRFADQPEIAADLRNTIGLAYLNLGATAAAESHLTAALGLQEKAVGAGHLGTLTMVNNLAELYRETGDYRRAEPLYLRALAGFEKAVGPDHSNTITSVNNLALLYLAAGDHQRAEPLLVRVLAGFEKAVGPDHPSTLTSVNNLALLYKGLGDYRRAEPLYLRALAGREKALGPNHPSTLTSIDNLGMLYRATGEHTRAEPLYLRALAGFEKALGPDHPSTLTSVGNLGVLLAEMDRPAEAVPLLERAYRARLKYPQHGAAGPYLSGAYSRVGRPADAGRVVGEQLAEGRARLKPGSPELGGVLANAGKALLDLDPAAAEAVLRECLALREKLAPAGWGTANAKSMLGGALLLQGQPAEAEPLLVAGYAGLVADIKSIPPQGRDNLPEAVERLARVYLALKKPDEAAKWRAERKKYPPDTAPRPRVVRPVAPPPREGRRPGGA